MIGFEPRNSRSISVDVDEEPTTTLATSTGNWTIYQKNVFPETSKIRRNSENPEKTEILVFRISEKSIR